MATAKTDARIVARKAKIADLKTQLRAAKTAQFQARKVLNAADRTHLRAGRATNKIAAQLNKLQSAA
jgi:hypothetical protein